VDEVSVRNMDEATAPLTFNNIDPKTGRVLITPRGPDPIFFGIRGENPEVVKKAFGIVRVGEPVERWVVFRTNHGTDAHLKRIDTIRSVQSFHPVTIRGTVVDKPRNVRLRHVIFSITDGKEKVDCAAYEPTGELRKAARQLMVNDEVEVSGGVRSASGTRPLTINLEKIRVIKLVSKISLHNPRCPNCGKTMSSIGRMQGFRCEKCGFKSKQLTKTQVIETRGLKEGLYITSPHSQRHLTKPFRRYGQEKNLNRASFKMIREWHSP
jgi:tRNA(Ile2)-agmatinylcytidine synthase